MQLESSSQVKRRAGAVAGLAAAVSLVTACAVASPQAAEDATVGARTAPLVIGHRGAAGYLPDHTLEGYALAIALGADYVDVDLVATRDGHLVARHEPNLVATTNVKDLPQFAGRRRKAMVDGVEQEGFFASDFTLAEIRTLRAVQPRSDRDARFDGRFALPTLDEVIALVKRRSSEAGRTIGVYLETKHPTWHQSLGLPLEEPLLAVLERAGWNRRDAPVFIQSFETANLRALRARTAVRLVQLVDGQAVRADGGLDLSPPFDRPYDWTASGRSGSFQDLLAPAGLAEVAQYADAIAPWKPYLQSWAGTTLLPPTSVVADAHRAGLLVHAFTFRNEASEMAPHFGGNPVAEYLHFFELGVDGVFSDFPDTAVAARAMFRLATDPPHVEQRGE
jgi:glycerophosphoryl diester phosphodiesterase